MLEDCKLVRVDTDSCVTLSNLSQQVYIAETTVLHDIDKCKLTSLSLELRDNVLCYIHLTTEIKIN